MTAAQPSDEELEFGRKVSQCRRWKKMYVHVRVREKLGRNSRRDQIEKREREDRSLSLKSGRTAR